MVLVEEPLPVELLLELFKGHVEVPHPLGDEGGALELIGAVPDEEGHLPQGDDLHAVRRLKAQARRPPPEEDAPDGPFRVLQGEVVVPGGVELVVGDLPPDVDPGEGRFAVQEVLDQIVEVRNGVDMLFHRSTSRVYGKRAHRGLCAHRV